MDLYLVDGARTPFGNDGGVESRCAVSRDAEMPRPQARTPIPARTRIMIAIDEGCGLTLELSCNAHLIMRAERAISKGCVVSFSDR